MNHFDINLGVLLSFLLFFGSACGCTRNERPNDVVAPAGSDVARRGYFAHSKVEDSNGVIAPWYEGQNGQVDQRIRISIDVLKRFPWTKDVSPATPAYIPNGRASVKTDGAIEILPLEEGGSGDLVNRAGWTVAAWAQYYAYSGDPAAFAHINMIVDYIFSKCLTPKTDSWPQMVFSVPFQTAPNGDCRGSVQLDVAALTGYRFLAAYQMNPNPQWLAILKNWGDLFVANMETDIQKAPWNRFDRSDRPVIWKPFNNQMTGSLSYVLFFLDELIKVTNPPPQSDLRKALARGEAYLRDVLLPRWYIKDTWGRSYWDVEGPEHETLVADMAAQYMLKNRDRFPKWKTDVRRLHGLNIMRTSGNPTSSPGLYSGAWQYPESASCCADSIGYAPVFGSSGISQYGALLNDPLFLEKSRRMSILVTYDATNTGYTEDLIFGGQLIYKEWVNIAYPYHIISHLKAIAQQPDVLAPNGENHLLDSTAAIQTIQYKADGVEYTTLRSPSENIDLLKISFEPTKITSSGTELKKRTDLLENGYTLQDLKNGDYILKIRHDLTNQVTVQGPTTNAVIPLSENLTKPHQFDFTGNQIYIVGRAGPNGGQAKIKLDGQIISTPVDLWNQEEMIGVVWSMVGLGNSKHTVEILPVQSQNPRTKGSNLNLTQAWSVGRATSAVPPNSFSAKDQKVILGYVGRENLIDQNGSEWWPGLDIIFNFGGPHPNNIDLVLPTLWTEPLPCQGDKCIFAYGVHATDFSYGFIAVPGNKYRLKLHFNCTRASTLKSKMLFKVNNTQEFKDEDILASCQSSNKADKVVTLEKTNLSPVNGAVQLHFKASEAGHEAFVSAIELNPM